MGRALISGRKEDGQVIYDRLKTWISLKLSFVRNSQAHAEMEEKLTKIRQTIKDVNKNCDENIQN